MDDQMKILEAVVNIVSCLKTDSDIDLNPIEVKKELMKDLKVNGNIIPSKSQIELLVMGDDEGTISGKLQKLFPNLNKLLDEEF